MSADLILGCLAQALPGRVPAEGASCLWDLPLRHDAMAALTGQATPFATEFSHNGGTGARPGSDGLSATAFPSGVWGTQVEIAESTCPVRYRRRELIIDSGGPGTQRGGLGQLIELESSEDAPILFFGTVERTQNPALGRDGGGAGRLGRMTLRSGPSFKAKGEQVIPAGDLLYFETPGGGGFGADVCITFPISLAAFGMADDYMTDADVREHFGRHVAGMRAGLRRVAVLRPNPQAASDHLRKKRKGRADQRADVFARRSRRRYGVDEPHRIDGRVHFPVSGDQSATHVSGPLAPVVRGEC